MAYTALRDTSKNGSKVYEGELGDLTGLKEKVLHFITDSCENLGFSPEKTEQEIKTGVFQGKSLRENDIPYNMQMDIDRLCMANALSRFIDSGTAHDAFDVYVCYIEMFWGSYGKCRHIIEMLSEFETNGSSLLMKHRDHYSHSVYVFAIGLAIYEANKQFRRTYANAYGFEVDSKEAAYHYIEFWGMTALFHDIGYPFELPFEEVCGYFEEDRDAVDDQALKKARTNRENRPFLAYQDIYKYINLSKDQSKALLGLYGLDKDISFFSTTNDLYAYNLENKLGSTYYFTKDSISQILGSKPERPDLFGCFMDHAFFSAAILFRELNETIGIESISKSHIDALTAILLHNSLYKFSIGFVKHPNTKPLEMNLHPLAYMLMLCDELQCWDRTAYGRNSRTQLHPMECIFSFDEENVVVQYIFDEEEKEKAENYRCAYKEKGDNAGKLKAYSDFIKTRQGRGGDGEVTGFQRDIEDIINCYGNGLIIKVLEPDYGQKGEKHTYISDSNFLHLYNFAAALNARYNYGEKDLDGVSDKEVSTAFESLSLEYKLSNIGQARSFAKYLDRIGCFFTDRSVDYPMVKEFSEDELEKIGPLEHGRWLMEHQAMGWVFGDSYKTDPSAKDDDSEKEKIKRKVLRENMRVHELVMDGPLTEERVKKHYDELPEGEKQKDTEPMRVMLSLISKYDGLRIYRYKKIYRFKIKNRR